VIPGFGLLGAWASGSSKRGCRGQLTDGEYRKPTIAVRLSIGGGEKPKYLRILIHAGIRRRPAVLGIHVSKLLKLASCAAVAFVCLGPVSSVAGVTGSGSSYTLDCSDGLTSARTVSATQTTTVTIQNCAYYLTTGTGISPIGNAYNGGATLVVTVDPGAVGRVDGYNAGQPPVGADARMTFVAPTPAAVPTMSEWAMILFAVAMAGAAAIIIPKRRTA